ncbi:uncharacterized protein LOC133337028 [Musca vetustissima]|uniref:uncharacterized protein LOC133337028 n=1 Tax=Musca vetustissima TaxID=27455 RepID=UPI002AB68054|nr:uncharacterized protein LOC133337028 [Musca vetustissima]
MLVQDNQRVQYMYFLLSGIVASSLLILAYVALSTRANENLQNDIKSMQLSLDLIKPTSLVWSYNNTWRNLGHGWMRHKIYSAYFDRRVEILDYPIDATLGIAIGSVRIFAILPLYFRDEIACIFRGEDFSLTKSMAQTTKPLQDHNDSTFAAYAIVCPLYRQMNESLVIRLPHAVAIKYKSNSLNKDSPTFVPISYPRDMNQLFAKSKPILSICVAPLQANTTTALGLVEFIEMYRLLGAGHFYFYAATYTKEVTDILSYYRKLGFVDTLHWNLGDHQLDLYMGGSVAQINDCIYRAMSVDNFRYTAIVGLDEYLMPLKHNSLLRFMLQCDEGLTASYVFRNVFFYKKDRSDSFSIPERATNRLLITQTKVKRSLEIMPAFTNSRFIVNTHASVEMGTKRLWRAAPGYTDHVLSPTVGLLFHYRNHCINCRSVMLIDYTARRFGSLLWDRVDNACLQLFLKDKGVCPTKPTPS